MLTKARNAPKSNFEIRPDRNWNLGQDDFFVSAPYSGFNNLHMQT